MFKTSTAKKEFFTGMIQEGTTISGTLQFTGTFQVDGRLEGDLVCSANVDHSDGTTFIVGRTGSVASQTIQSDNIVIEGKVTSQSIHGITVHISKGANVTGATITYRNLEIDESSVIHNCRLINLNVEDPAQREDEK